MKKPTIGHCVPDLRHLTPQEFTAWLREDNARRQRRVRSPVAQVAEAADLILVARSRSNAYSVLGGIDMPVVSVTANTLAAALELLSGKPATALCVWCLMDCDPHEVKPVRRPIAGGDCYRCPYSGVDVLVVGNMSTAEARAIPRRAIIEAA